MRDSAGDLGWSERHFSTEARSYLLDEARNAVQEQLRFLASQDVRVVATFTISLLLVSATGIVGDIRLSADIVSLLTLIALALSVVVWICCWAAYFTRTVAFSVDVTILTRSYRGAEADELRAASLEALVEAFALNEQTIDAQGRWLRYAIVGLGVQLMLLVATIVAGAPTNT